MGFAARFTMIPACILSLAIFSGSAFAKTVCESEIEHRTLVVDLTQDLIGTGGATQKDLVKAEIVLHEAERNCGAIEDATYKVKMIASYAELVSIAEREFREGTASLAEYAAAQVSALDLRWQVVAISTAEYCKEKFDLLQQRRAAAHESVGAGALRSLLLEAELAIQKHREFCDLEGSIVLPPDPAL